MAWEQQGYYQDPYQQHYDQNYGYDPYWGYDQGPVEDTESVKLRKEEEEKARMEALFSNRLYLQKVKKRCVQEDFADLEKLQLFLFEVLVETLEVDAQSTLGLNQHSDDVIVRAQFLNSPNLEIREKDEVREDIVGDGESGYLQTLGEAGLGEAHETRGEVSTIDNNETTYTTKWQQASGKSCLFSMTPLAVIQDLDRYPVNIQVVLDAKGSDTSEPIGYARVRLPEEFSLSILQSCKDNVVLPVSCVHRETCDLKNVFGVRKGKLDVFVRLSSFGPAIITSFHTSGADRRYVFTPSPMSTYFKVNEEVEEPPRNEVLRPVIAEEEIACGITVMKEADIFQKPVLWKKGTQGPNCGCVQEGDCIKGDCMDCVSIDVDLRLPMSSDISLCRDVRPPTNQHALKRFGKPLCDWHNMVGLEIKNSPKGNCGCLDSINEGTQKLQKDVGGNCASLKHDKESSRIAKMISINPSGIPSTGLGLTPTPDGCNCDCPDIRESLRAKKMFPI